MRLPAQMSSNALVRRGWIVAWLVVASAAASVWWLAMAYPSSPSVVDKGGASAPQQDRAVMSGELPPEQQAIVDSLTGAVKRPGYVFHIAWSQQDNGGIEHEAWIDATAGLARVERMRDGELEGLEIVEGNAISAYVIGGRDSYQGETTGHIREPYLKVLPYLEDLAHIPNVAQSPVGVAMSESLIQSEGFVPSADGSALCSGAFKLYVQRETPLPLRSEEVLACPGQRPVVSAVTTYSHGEFLPVSAFAGGFFAGPSVADQFVTRQLERARELGFPVFALDEPKSFGLRLVHAQVARQSSGAPMVNLIYTSTSRTGPWLPDFAVAQGQRGTMPDKTCEAPATLRQETLAGVTAFLCAGVSTGALIKLENTTIYLYAMAHFDAKGRDTNQLNSEDALQRVADALSVLN